MAMQHPEVGRSYCAAELRLDGEHGPETLEARTRSPLRFAPSFAYARNPLIPHLQELDLIASWLPSDPEGIQVLTHADVRHLGALPYVPAGCKS